MDIQKVKKKVQQGDIAPVYVLYGTEKYLIDELIQLIARQALGEEDMDFNYETFDLNEYPLEEAVEAAETFPFMGEKRVVVAREAYFLTATKAQSKVEHDLRSLERYLSSPATFSILIFVINENKLDVRKKVVKLLKQKAAVCSSSGMREQQLIPWLQEQATELDVHIRTDACEFLLQFVGDNMHMLTNEMEKMAQFVGKEGTITAEVVQQLIAKTVEQDVFVMIDQVMRLQLKKAFDGLHELLKRNEEPIKILFLLARQFRIIYKVKELGRQGYSPKQMASIVGVHPYVCKLAVEQGRSYSLKQLQHILDQLAEMDYEIKTGRKDKVLALEMFLLRLPQA